LAGLLTRAKAQPHLLDALAILIVVGGGAIRFYRSTALSLWLDEGFTVYFSRLPWNSVLGLNGSYDVHPPLYYALVKAVSIVLPEVVAARYLSVVAGTATLAVLYLLVGRIAGKHVALVACLVAAVSPLAVWYSQEGRQYAVTGLAVSVAYLALASFYMRPSKRWALAYGVALASAVYLDYSAFYALAPQLVLLPVVLYRHRRDAIPLMVAGAAAVVAYLPWLSNVVDSIHTLGNSRDSYLAANPSAFKEELFSIMGFNGQGIYFYSSTLSPWERWSALHPAFWVLVVAAIALGSIGLVRNRFGSMLTWALFIGTPVAAYLLSQISPGFAPRTVSYAVLGWAILVGGAGAAAAGGMAKLRRAAGWVVVVALITVSLASLQAVYDGQKQDWRGWAGGVAEASQFGYPIVYFPTIAPTFADAYEHGSLAGSQLDMGDVPDLAALGAFVKDQQAFWVASMDIDSGSTIEPFLRSDGFVRVASEQYENMLSVNLYVRSGANLGSPVPVNTTFTPASTGSPGWTLPPGLSSVQPGVSGPELTLSDSGGTEASAVLTTAAAPHHLYSLTFEARSRLSAGTMRAFLICTGRGTWLNVAPNQGGAGVPEGPGWQKLTISAICPDGTDQIRIDLRNAGAGALDLRGVQLFDVARR
jgi:hypothetical protein